MRRTQVRSLSSATDAHSSGCKGVKRALDSVPLEMANEFPGGWVEGHVDDEGAYRLHETLRLIAETIEAQSSVRRM